MAYAIVLILTDILSFSLAIFIAISSRIGLQGLFSNLPPLQIPYNTLHELWYLPAAVFGSLAYERLYWRRLSSFDEFRIVAKSLVLSIVIIFVMVTLRKTPDQISRLTLVLFCLTGIAVFPILRFSTKYVMFKAGVSTEDILILGAGQAGKAICLEISRQKNLGYRVVGFLDDNTKLQNKIIESTGKKVLGKITDYEKKIREMNISTVVLALPSAGSDKLAKLAATIQMKVKRLLVVPDMKGVALLNSELHHFFTEQLFMIKIRNNLQTLGSRIIKLVFDYIMTILMLPFLLILIAVLGLLIKLDSPGPVFYRHDRIGRNGRRIGVFKFRSMYRDSKEKLEKILNTDKAARAEWQKYFKLKDDPRITRIGKFLRRSSLDELPQIFNVLKGEMSLVGPRPVLEDELQNYYREQRSFYEFVRPGISGLWQVSGRNEIDYDKRVSLDTWYVLNWSVWLDILILYKTADVVLKKKGAF